MPAHPPSTSSHASREDPGISIITELDGFSPGVDKITVTIPRNGATKLFARLVVDTP